MDDPVALTVVVPTRDRPTMLASCLDALLGARPAPAEVIVVDSASLRADAVDPARTGGASVLRCGLPGASRARNLGWRAATQPVVAFVDDDVEVSSDWAARILAPFTDPSVALVTGGVGADQRSHGRSVATTDGVPVGRFTLAEVGNVGASANLAVRRRVLERIGGFDELLGAGGRFRAAEDLDLFDRALTEGVGWHAPDAHALHHQWRDRRALMQLELAYGIGFGARITKLVRRDRRRARALAWFELRRLGRETVDDVRRRYRFGLLSRLLWLVGFVGGSARAATLPVRDGLLQPRRRA